MNDEGKRETQGAGSSARREHERRKARREQTVRAKHPKLGGLILAVTDDPQSTRAWQRGAVGEEKVGARLDTLSTKGTQVLHDRRIPRTRANLDHLVVTPAGVWVVDTKRYAGRPHRESSGGLFSPRRHRLLVGRRDCTQLVEAMHRQVALVQSVVANVPVSGALCFVDADWPVLAGDFEVDGVRVTSPRRLVTRLDGLSGEVDVAAVTTALSGHFPPA